jgi:hypothetical protein
MNGREGGRICFCLSYLKDFEGILIETLVKGDHTFVPLVEFILNIVKS